MMVEKLIAIKDLTSPKQKLQLVKEILQTASYELKILIYLFLILVYDKTVDFNLKLTTKQKKEFINSFPDSEEFSIEKVDKILLMLYSFVKSRKTWNEFRKYIQNAKDVNLNKKEAIAITLALDKNLGIGYKTVVKELKNEILSEFSAIKIAVEKLNMVIKRLHPFISHSAYREFNLDENSIILPFAPFSLANKYHERKDKIEGDTVIIQPKYDGFRAVIDEKGRIYTRNHELINVRERNRLNLLSLVEELEKLYEKLGENVLFDGEIFYKDFQTTMSLATKEKFSTKEEANSIYSSPLKFYVFDVVDRDIFSKYYFQTEIINPKSQYERLTWLRDVVNPIIKELELKQIEIVPLYTCRNHMKEIKELTGKFIADGYEGSMIKQMDKPYKFDRHDFWLKNKPIKEVEAKIIDFKEGEGKYENTLGAIIVELPNGKICKVSGMPEDIRDEIWNNKEKYLNKLVEIKYQELTPDGVLRFPRVEKIRLDKDLSEWNKEI